jgi:transposase InsO family protein
LVSPINPGSAPRSLALRPDTDATVVQLWHIDTSVIKLLDGTKVYLQAVLDNYSPKILVWTVTERFAPSIACQVLLAAVGW